MPRFHNISGTRVQFTAEEETARDAEEQAWADGEATRKLTKIRRFRLIKLKGTDYLANSDMTMSENIKTWRQPLRDIPANHTDEASYDLLLANDADGVLTHEIWTKP